MKRTFLVLPFAGVLCLALVMFGCKADVDLNNITDAVYSVVLSASVEDLTEAITE